MPQLSQLSQVYLSQFLWLAIGLGFIFFVIARGMVPKIQATVDMREKKIAADLEVAQAARTAADETEAAKLASDAKQASAKDTDAQVHAASIKIDAKLEKAGSQIREALESARSE